MKERGIGKRKKENGKFGESSESGVGAFKVKEEGEKKNKAIEKSGTAV